MATHSGPRAEWWFGKRTKLEPGTEAGTDAAGRWGKVSRTHRWFSYDWWFGHHMQRESDGTWKDERGFGAARARRSGLTARKTTKEQQRRRDVNAYAGYLHERYLAAEKATRGYMVSKAGQARGISGEDFFDVDTRRRPSVSKWGSDELKAWFGDSSAAAGSKGHRGGRLLSQSAYLAQTTEREAA